MKTSTILWGAGGFATLAILAAIAYRRTHPVTTPQDQLFGEGLATDFTEAVGTQAPAPGTAVLTTPPAAGVLTTATSIKPPSGKITTVASKVGGAPASSTPVITATNFSFGNAVGGSTAPVNLAATSVGEPPGAVAGIPNMTSGLAQAMLDALCADHRKLDGVPADQREGWRQAMIARGCLSSPVVAKPGDTGMVASVGSVNFSPSYTMKGRRGILDRLGL